MAGEMLGRSACAEKQFIGPAREFNDLPVKKVSALGELDSMMVNHLERLTSIHLRLQSKRDSLFGSKVEKTPGPDARPAPAAVLPRLGLIADDTRYLIGQIEDLVTELEAA